MDCSYLAQKAALGYNQQGAEVCNSHLKRENKRSRYKNKAAPNTSAFFL